MWNAVLLLACAADLTIATSDVTKPVHKCPPNEVFSNCTNGGCDARNCSQAGKPVRCVKLDPKSCIKGCVCQPGYLRLANGTCVPQNQCNEGCGNDPNAHPGCGVNCGRTCATYQTKNVPCILICNLNGCDCNDGYVFDPYVKKCVLPKDCTCGINEVYDVCPAPCPPRRCDVDDRLIKCVAPPKPGDPACKPGCRCADGYARNATGTCVLREQCEQPLTCDQPNEIYDSCPAPCPGDSCDVDPAVVLCLRGPQYGDPACKPACRCIDGYARNAANECVPRDQCPPKCELYEVYSNCTNGGCDARNCSQAGKPVPCVKLDPKSCKKGCVCQPGYLRLANGTCVPQKQCNEGCGNDPNAHPGCGVNCGRTCATYKKKNVPCPKICKVNGCDCNDGYVFDPNVQKCVSPKHCTPTCGLNEVYSNCTNGGCDARNCSQAGKPVPCVKLDPKSCIKGCVCQPGYLRLANGTCVPQNQCNEGCGDDPNAHPGCGVNCGRTCATYKKKDVACILICYLNGCDCNKGYVFDPNIKKCVLPKYCTPTCGLNEVYSNCTNGGCDARNCSQVGKPVPCVKLDPKSCIKGCVCQPGYLRLANGTCVPRNQCNEGTPFRCGGDPNAQPGCGYNCGKTCTTYKAKRPICPRIACKLNGCDCKDGYVFDSNVKKCVLPQECITCGINEVYDVCPAPCPPRRCDVDDRLIKCAAPPKPGDPKCKPGCRCADGYARNATGTCVLREKCEQPLTCDQPNEIYDSCPAPCPGDSCDVDPAVVLCLRGPQYGDPACKPACRCIDGYARNAANECVPRDQCPPKCELNEVYSNCTNGGCDARNCSQAGKPVPCVKLDPKSCKKGCVCQPGYLRLANGTCVPQKQCNEGCGNDPNAHPGCGVNCGRTCATYKKKNVPCPKICKVNGCDCNDGYVFDPNVQKCVSPKHCTPTCGLNEVYSNCTNGGCDARNCSQAGKPVPCVKLDPKSCKKGCVCQPGYLRLANGTCVPQNQCNEGCGDDPNAHPGCGVNCGRTCATYKKKDVACILICYLNGCDCNKGYVFDPNVKKCVLPKYCTPTCGLNEVYSNCTNGGCDARNCSQVGKPVPCVKLDPKSCIKGCVCQPGYLRLANGTCVPRNQCNEGCGGDPNAQPGCGYNCGKTCTTYKAKRPICPRIACKLNGCDCKDGYVFDYNVKKCVLPQECITCGINEVYDVCPAPCPPRRCDVDDRLIKCAAPPKPGDPKCKPGCRCADGYARNATGTCVLREKCEQPLNCDQPNEIYDSCPAPCPGDSCDVDPAVVLCLPSPEYGDPACKPACRCIDGYARNDANECVPREQCPSKNEQCPGQNEFFDTCISGCSNQSCDSIGKVIHCPKQPAVCRTGCRCNPGFYRNASNVCVPESQCPTPPCPKGEVYSRCPTVKCEGDYCPKDRNSPHTCPVGIVCDPPRCVCGPLDRRDRKTGKCIRASNCPPFKCDGPNEEYQPCPATCPGEKCADYINDTKCPPYRIGIVVACKPQCRCKKGYYRNSDGICISACQCGDKTTTTPVTPVIIDTDPTTAKPTTPSGNNSDGQDQRENLKVAITGFNGKFLYNRIKASPGENIITSPYSVIPLLAQLALYAVGDSWKQLTSILNLTSKQDIRKTFPAWADSFCGQTSVNFSIAGRLFSSQQYPISDGFNEDSFDILGADTQELNFSKYIEAAKTINGWVESKTNNLIKDLISSSDLSALTRLVLVNAIYYKGDWQNPFNKNYTKEADFYLSDGKTKKTKLMFQEGYFNYGESPELNCTVLEMFYKGRNFSMIIVLPNEKDGVLSTAKNLQDATNFNKVLGSIRSNKVKVYLPPFEINTSTDLATILKQEGVTKIFDSKDSGLTGILKNDEKTIIYVSKAIQKAHIKTNENGSEAAVANAIVVGATSAITPPRNIVFRCDRGFLYYIAFRRTVIFSGALVKPN